MRKATAKSSTTKSNKNPLKVRFLFCVIESFFWSRLYVYVLSSRLPRLTLLFSRHRDASTTKINRPQTLREQSHWWRGAVQFQYYVVLVSCMIRKSGQSLSAHNVLFNVLVATVAADFGNRNDTTTMANTNNNYWRGLRLLHDGATGGCCRCWTVPAEPGLCSDDLFSAHHFYNNY